MKTISGPLKASGILVLILSILFFACKKDASVDTSIPPGKTKFSVYLTDGPYDFQKVLIDIQQIAVKLDTCDHQNGEGDDDDDSHHEPGCDEDHDRRNSDCDVWDTLDIKPGVYDIMQFRNGLDTLIGSDFILNGRVKRIKFTLGDNNSIIADSTEHPLQLINGQHFVYLDLHRKHLDSISSNDLQLYLDFNLAKSIKYHDGKYWIKPVLRPFSPRYGGAIEGKVSPAHSFGVVKAFSDADTAFALPWKEGEFKIRGLKEGTYSIVVEGDRGFKDTTLTNISVTRYNVTNVGTIELHR